MTALRPPSAAAPLWKSRETLIAAFTIAMIAAHLLLRFAFVRSATEQNIPLWTAFALGGVPLVWELTAKLLRREFGSDLLAGISIITSDLLEE